MAETGRGPDRPYIRCAGGVSGRRGQAQWGASRGVGAAPCPRRVSERAVTLTHDNPSGPDLRETPPSSPTTTPAEPTTTSPSPRTRGGTRRSARRRLRAGAPQPLFPAPARGRGQRSAARRGPGLRGPGPRGPGHRARLPLRPTLRWRVLVATLGAILLTVCSGMALGVVTWTSSGLGLNFRSAPQPPPLVAGADGVWPGGPARSIPLTVQNTEATAFEITDVRPDLTTLPATCPAHVWQVAVPELLSTVPARSEVTVPLPVSLREDAPETCQGVTVRFPVRIDGLRHPRPLSGAGVAGGSSGDAAGGGTAASGVAAPWSEHLTATATVTAARLGGPSGTVNVREGGIEIAPTRPAKGPTPARYDVQVLGSGTQRIDLCVGTPGPCIDHDAPKAAARRYLVTARLGTRWRQAGRPLTAWTPPPAPGLAFADGDRSAAPALVLTASGAASEYDIEVAADGMPFHRAVVAAGRPLSQIVPAPRLGHGRHRLTASALFHAWRAPSATLRLTISANGVTAPGPTEEPPPVTDGTDLTTPAGGPPVVPLPTSSTATPPTRTSPPPSTTIRRSTAARPVQAPPMPSIEEPGGGQPAADPLAPGPGVAGPGGAAPPQPIIESGAG